MCWLFTRLRTNTDVTTDDGQACRIGDKMRNAGVAMVAMTMICGAATAGAEGWKAVGWGGGGLYWACAFHPSGNGVLYMGGDVNGFYRSEDRGKRWAIRNAGLVNYAIYSLAVDARNPDTVYAGTTGGTCRSTDRGESWAFLADTAKDKLAIVSERGISVRALAVDHATGRVYAGTPAGKVYGSDDGGRSWKMLHDMAGKGAVRSVVVVPGKPATVLAATERIGLLASMDGGRTWKRLRTPDSTSHAAAGPGGKVLYAACGKAGVWKSVDAGKTWKASGNGMDPACEVREVAVNAKSPSTVYAIGSSDWSGYFYRSMDGGKTWKAARQMTVDRVGNPTLPEEYGPGTGKGDMSMLTNLAVNPGNPSELFVSANWRTAFSPDGGVTWEERDSGADITCVTDIRFLGDKTYVTAMDEGLLVSADQGGSWRQLVPRKYDAATSGHEWRVIVWEGPGGATNIVATNSPWNAAGNAALVSPDGGASFIQCRGGLPEKRPRLNTMWGEGYARALAADPRTPQTLYLGIDGDPEPGRSEPGRSEPGRPEPGRSEPGRSEPGKEETGGGIFKSLNGGKTWKRLAAQPASRRGFYGLDVDPTDPRRIFWGACGDNGGLHRSEDGGETWRRVFKEETWVFNAGVSASGAVYSLGSNVWRSVDHGNTWKRISGFSDGLAIVGLAIHPADDNVIWISKVSWGEDSGGGVYKTVDGGVTWTEITGDLPNRKPLVLRFNATTSELWAGGAGLYRISQ